MNSASGSLIGGRRIFVPESNSAAKASPSRICDAAIENRIAMTEAASQIERGALEIRFQVCRLTDDGTVSAPAWNRGRGRSRTTGFGARADVRRKKAAAHGAENGAARGCFAVVDLTSPYKRAVQTAQIAAECLKYKGELVQSDALLPSAKPEDAWEEIRLHQRESQLLLAGHDPLFSDLAGYLLGFPGLRMDFRKGALLRIDFDRYGPQPHGTLRWFLVPKLAAD